MLETTDEIPDPSKLTLQTRLNGMVVQNTTTDLMITPVPELIAYISTICPLAPGDVIVTGTPGGVGLKRTPRDAGLQLLPAAGAVVNTSFSLELEFPLFSEAKPELICRRLVGHKRIVGKLTEKRHQC